MSDALYFLLYYSLLFICYIVDYKCVIFDYVDYFSYLYKIY